MYVRAHLVHGCELRKVDDDTPEQASGVILAIGLQDREDEALLLERTKLVPVELA